MTDLQSRRVNRALPSPALRHDGSETMRRSILWTGFWSVIAALIPVMRTPLDGTWQLPQRPIEYTILLALVVSALLRLLARPVGLPVWLAAGAVVPFAGFVSGFSSSVSASVTMAVELAVVCVLAPAVFRFHVSQTRGFLPWVLGAFLASQTLSATAGLLQLTGAQILGRDAVFDRSTGFAGHPNVLGIMSVVALLTTLALLRDAPRPVKVGLWGAFAINSLALVATGSLSAMLAGALGATVFAIGGRRLAAATVVVAGAGMVILLGDIWIFSVVETRVAVVTGAADVGGAASVDVRLLTYQWALEHLSKDPLFGVGMDYASAGTFDGVTVVHNYLLHAWYQGGLALFIWFVAVTAVLVTSITRALRYRQSVGAASIVAAFIAFAATSAFFTQEQYWIPLLFAVAMLPNPSPRGANLRPPAQPSSI